MEPSELEIHTGKVRERQPGWLGAGFRPHGHEQEIYVVRGSKQGQSPERTMEDGPAGF